MIWGGALHWGLWLVGLLAVYGLSKLGESLQAKRRPLYAAVLVAHVALALCLMALFPYQWGQSDDGCRTEYDKAGPHQVCE